MPGLKVAVGLGSGTERTVPFSAETGRAAADSESEAFLTPPAAEASGLLPPREIVVALSLPLGALAAEAARAAALASATAASAGASDGDAAGMASL